MVSDSRASFRNRLISAQDDQGREALSGNERAQGVREVLSGNERAQDDQGREALSGNERAQDDQGGAHAARKIVNLKFYLRYEHR